MNSYSVQRLGTSMVPVRKSTLPGDKPRSRVCSDYSVTTNSQLAVHHHPLPLPEDLVRKLGRGYGFTKINLADAYNQVRLGPDSRKHLALSIHRGVLLQNVFLFGILSAPGYFQKIMEDFTSDLPGVAVYLDDNSAKKMPRTITTISYHCWIAYMPKI